MMRQVISESFDTLNDPCRNDDIPLNGALYRTQISYQIINNIVVINPYTDHEYIHYQLTLL